ncbi:MAG: alpha/beta hydrolase [Chloroflexi bacterium]|nr:alpha/beta hydrolase [Chloroflexota bacterium]
MQTQGFKTVNGHEIVADIYPLSHARDGENLPAVLFIHGGGLIMGHRKMIAPSHIQAFHEGGFHVISIDYRLAPETKLPEIADDIQDAWHWLREKAESFGIARERIAIVGHSAGAFLTLMSGYRLDPRPAALVAMAGYGKLTHDEFKKPSPYYVQQHAAADANDARSSVGAGTISASGPNDSMQRYTGRGLFYLYCRQQGIWLREVTGHNLSDQEWFAQYEPIRNVSAAYPPTILLHGEADTDVPFDQSVLMQQELNRHGIAHAFISNPNWGHGFLYVPHDPSVNKAFTQIIAFLHQHV